MQQFRRRNGNYSLATPRKVCCAKVLFVVRSISLGSYAYVPSIRVTPTTIQLQPLRLVKRHRILREQNFNDPMSLALVEIRDEANKPLYTRDFRSLRTKFEQILTNGIEVNRIRYRYLHHSMSQVKEKQFWFLDCRYPLEDVLAWMGNFDNERVVAKHAARIAQCFTSTEPSIQVCQSEEFSSKSKSLSLVVDSRRTCYIHCGY